MTVRSRPPALLAAGNGLREARMSRRISLRKLAAKLGFSPQSLSQWETGTRAPSESDAAWILGFLRVDRDEHKRVMEFVRQCNESNLIESLDSATEPLLWTYERLSCRIFEWAPLLLPELLQTSTYTRASCTGERNDGNAVDVAVFQCQVRQEVLRNRKDHRCIFLIGEAALLGGPISPPIPQEQLHHLKSLESDKTVTLRIVPAEAGSCEMIDPFVVFEDEDRRPTAALRHHHNNVYITSSPLAGRYRETIDQLRRAALDAQASLDFLRSL